jgi:serine/threonine protein kinase
MGYHKIYENKMVHRDLKPNNIFIVGDSETAGKIAKIGDFGLADSVEEDGRT